jgi:hypothetical protein
MMSWTGAVRYIAVRYIAVRYIKGKGCGELYVLREVGATHRILSQNHKTHALE